MTSVFLPRGARPLMLWGVSGLLAIAGSSLGDDKPATMPATAPATRPATQPATRPAPDTVLVRFGNEAFITQGDWDRETLGMTLEEYEINKFYIGLVMGEVRRLQLYLDDHPELVPQERLDEEIERLLRSARVETIDELNALMVERGSSFAEVREQVRLKLGRTAIILRGIEAGKDDAALTKLYQQDPDKYGDAKVQIRHIMLLTYPWDTPEQLAEKRARLEKMKRQIEAGEKKFEDFIPESEVTQRLPAGDLGFEPQIISRVPDAIPQAAFPLKPMEMTIVRSTHGLHLVQAGQKQPAWRPIEEAKHYMRIWMEAKAFRDAMDEVEAKYPMIGVREPAPPDQGPEAMALREKAKEPPPPRTASSRPAGRSPSTRPGGVRRPVTTRPVTTRPAATRSPATRPAGAATRPAGAPAAR